MYYRLFALFVVVGFIAFFAPVKFMFARLRPLPHDVQSRLLQALDDGFDGIIAYVESKDQSARLCTAGWYNREKPPPGYQSLATYFSDTDTVLVLFVNTTDFSNDNHWAIFELMNSRIKEIVTNE
jgi:hypothetical protein